MLHLTPTFSRTADFSAAIRVEPTDKPCTDVVGVIYWQAPEVREYVRVEIPIRLTDMTTSGSYDPLKVDVFSLGATVWEMAQHEPPFVTVQDVSQVEAQWPPLDKPDDFTFDFHHFLRACSMVAHCRPAPNDLLTVRIASSYILILANLLLRRFSYAARLLGGTLFRYWRNVD
jgi:hypothetical protein